MIFSKSGLISLNATKILSFQVQQCSAHEGQLVPYHKDCRRDNESTMASGGNKCCDSVLCNGSWGPKSLNPEQQPKTASSWQATAASVSSVPASSTPAAGAEATEHLERT